MQNEERWTQIEGWPYEISTHGRVRRMPGPNSPSGRILKPSVYARVRMCDRGRNVQQLAHVLVAKAFLGPMPTPQHDQVNHKDGDTLNNRFENLEWVTRRENQLHAIHEGLSAGHGEDHPRAKLTNAQVSEIRRTYTGALGEQTAIAKKYGVSQMLISKIITRAIWDHLDDDDPSNVRSATRAKLTDEQNAKIRGRYTGKRGEQAALAREYGVTPTQISRILKGPAPKGEPKSRRRKLTATKVRNLRVAYANGAKLRKLAKKYGITRQTARDIIDGRTWKHVTKEAATGG